MKIIFVLAALISFTNSFSQWTRVTQLPSTDISSLYHKDNTLYAGGKNLIYISKNNGLTWDSTSTIPQFVFVTSIIVYNNELYAAAPHKGVFKSADEGATWQGTTWQNFTGNTFPDVADFCEFQGKLYAATLGNSVYKLNPANGNSWLFFSNGLSDLSANLPVIASNSNAMIAGTMANGIYDHLPSNSITWEERLLSGVIDPNEGGYAIAAAHDTLFYAGRRGNFYISTDDGLTWSLVGDRLVSAATSMVNAKQAVIISRHIFEGGDFKTLFHYIKKDSLQSPFVKFSVVAGAHFTYKIDALGNKLWDASNKGLFFMSLSDLPGITAADDTGTHIILPVSFVLFNAKCEEFKATINWKTTNEHNSSHFTIERSVNNVDWITIGSQRAVGTSVLENSYSFADSNPVQNSYYRIAQHDLDGRVLYSTIIKSSCKPAETLSAWPSPFLDKLTIGISTGRSSQVAIKIIDAKGATLKLYKVATVQGNNQLTIDLKFLPSGLYHLSASWNNGYMQKAIQVVKM
jgi:photosystem II stability/assembly factor-like uncharacterized protein